LTVTTASSVTIKRLSVTDGTNGVAAAICVTGCVDATPRAGDAGIK
jgi:hypothetical protein